MVKSILGKKVGMTQIFDDAGRVVPVTVIEAGPCVVTQKKTLLKDKYEAVQIGYGDIKESRLNQPERGHLGLYASPRHPGGKTKLSPKRHLREVRMEGAAEMAVGDEIHVDVFTVGQRVDVTGTSKGKGFAGVVKRYHWHGGDMTHGSMIHRKPQSAGATDAARIFKNVGRPGHMGHERVTVKRLEVIRVDREKNMIVVRGAIPGPNGGMVMVREAKP